MDHVRFSTRALVLAGALAAAAFTLLLSSAPPALAIGEPFVSNMGQSDAFGTIVLRDDRQYAQAFTTGTAGGQLETVQLRFDGGSKDTTTAAIWSSTAAGLPDASVCALTNPNNLGSGGTKTFTTTSCTLSASTTYFVYLHYAGLSGDNYRLLYTTSADEDSGGLPGWSIADSYYRRSGGSWTEQSSSAIKIRLRGANVAPTAADSKVQADPGSTYEFHRDDFGFSDHSGDELEEVTISSVSGGGVLWLDANDDRIFDAGEAVSTTTSTAVTSDDLNNDRLKYTAPDTGGGAGLASFNFTVSDGDLDSAQHTMTIDVFTRLVSNEGQRDSGRRTTERRRAQGFVTGSNFQGYLVQSVDVKVDDNGETDGVNLKILQSAASNRPGAELCDLGSTPTRQTGDILRFSTSTNVCALERDTRYFVQFEEDSDSSYAYWRYTNDEGQEDSGWAAGWNIVDHAFYYSGGWNIATDHSLIMRLKGEIIPNALPTSADAAVTADEDTVYTFATSSFPFADADAGDTLGSVVITSLPHRGTLWLDADDDDTRDDSESVFRDELVALADIDKLKYTPLADRNGAAYTSFDFRVNDGYEDSADTYTLTIHVAPEVIGATTTSYTENGAGFVARYRINGSPTWGLSGVDSGLFTISGSGELNFINSPNYEDPQDANADNDYQVTVEAVVTAVVDNVQYSTTGTLDVTVSVTDVDEPPTVTAKSKANFVELRDGRWAVADDFPENSTSSIATFDVSDDDGDPILSVNVNQLASSPGDHGKLSVSFATSTGVVTLSFATTSTPDFENPADSGRDNTYEVSLEAITGTAQVNKSTSVRVLVTVTDLPTVSAASATSTPSYVENGTGAVDTYTATGNVGTVTWSLVGDDSGELTIATSTGVLDFDSPPNYELPTDANRDNVYEVTVVATDDNGTTADASDDEASRMNVWVTVTDVNEAPVANADSATTSEDTSFVIRVLDNDTDEDANSNLSVDSVSSVTNGATTTITDGGTTVTYTPAPNWNGVGSFAYTVTDGALTANGTVTVTVTAVNDAPVAFDDYATTTGGAAVVVNVLANDTDVEGDTLSLTGVTDPRKGAAVLDAGAVSTTTYTPNPGFAGFDRFTYTVTDGSLTATATATIGVLPTITGATTTSYSESGQVTVATYNANGSPTWGLAGVDADDFTISNELVDNGELDFVTPPDLESPADSDGDNVYNVVVTASITDDVTGNTVTSELAVTVTVTSLTDEPPVIHGGTGVTVTGTGNSRTATAPDFPENSTSTAATLTVDDDDAGHEIVEVALGSLDYGSFSATSSTSTATVTLSFKNAPDFENPTDLGSINRYHVWLTVKTASSTAAASTYLSSRIWVRVTVTDLPAVSAASGTSTPSYAENGTDAVDTYSATGAVGTVTWSLEGDDKDQFSIDSGTGELDFSSPPNYEFPTDANKDNVYEVTVVATDDNGTAGDATDDEVGRMNVQVTVTDANDAPVANLDRAVTRQDTFVVINVLENDTDEDGDPLTVTDASVTGINNRGSVTATSDGSAIEFTSNPWPYGFVASVTYTVSDGRGATTTGSVFLVVSEDVWHLSDLAISDLTSDLGFNPEVTEYSASVESTVDRVVVTLTPYVDANNEPFDNITVTVNGTPATSDNANVSVDLGGEVSTTTIEIVVTIEGTVPLYTRTYTVNVFRKLRPTPPDVSGPANINYDENGVGPVGAYSASDPNGDPTTWEALSGVDAGLFSFDAGAATLSFREAPDFESPADANRDNVYLVTLTVSDGTFDNTLDVSVTVRNVNDPPTTVGTVIDRTTLTAGDPPWRLDLSSNFADVDGDSLTYSVSSNRNGVASARITSAGTLSVTPLAAGSATIVVSASDGASNNDPATWTIAVTVNDAPTDQQDSRAQRSAAASAGPAAPVPVAPVIDGPPGEITTVAADEESDDTMVAVNPDQQTTVAAAEQDVTVVFPVSSRQDAFQARVTGCTIEDPAVGPLLACVTVDLFDAAGQRERDAQLSTPAGVNITLTPEQVEDVGGLSMLRTANDLGGLRLLKRDAATGSWTEVAVTLSVDEETGQATVSGSIFRFGDFVLVLDDEVIAQALASSDLLPRTGGPHVPGHILLALLIAGAALTAAGLRLLQTRRQTA